MKKYIVYSTLFLAGIFAGWFFFGEQTSNKSHDHDLEIVSEHWTCSMHPQIDLPEFGSCPICGMDLIPIDDSDSGLSINQFKMSENAVALANIETLIINNSSEVKQSVVLSGKIKENEKTKSIQAAHFNGRIEKLYINTTGEEVYKGELLALVYSPELVTAQSELLTAMEMKENQPYLYAAVRNKLKLWKVSDDQISTIETSKKTIINFPIYANVSGIITEKMVEEGNHVGEGEPLFKISNLYTVWAEFDIYEKQISLINIGDEIKITSNAAPMDTISATVSFIGPVLNSSTRTITIRAELENKSGNLKPGMFLTGIVTNDSKSVTKTPVISIPKSAVLWTGKRSVVYIRTSKSKSIFELREVILGNELTDTYIIVSGLTSGEEVVINGAFTVDAAAQLSGKKSMMNRSNKSLESNKDQEGMEDNQ